MKFILKSDCEVNYMLFRSKRLKGLDMHLGAQICACDSLAQAQNGLFASDVSLWRWMDLSVQQK